MSNEKKAEALRNRINKLSAKLRMAAMTQSRASHGGKGAGQRIAKRAERIRALKSEIIGLEGELQTYERITDPMSCAAASKRPAKRRSGR